MLAHVAPAVWTAGGLAPWLFVRTGGRGAGLSAIGAALAPDRHVVVFVARARPQTRTALPFVLAIVMVPTLPPLIFRLALAPAAVGTAVAIARTLALVVTLSLPRSILRFAVEVGGPVVILRFVGLDHGIEPFADRHAGAARRFARSRSCFPTETSQIPRTAGFHFRVHSTS